MKSRWIFLALLAAVAGAAAVRAQQAPPDTSEVILRDDMSDDEKIAALNRLLLRIWCAAPSHWLKKGRTHDTF